MSDYEIPARSTIGRDAVSAWVLYAIIIFAMIAVSTIHESLSRRPSEVVAKPTNATDGYSLSNQDPRSFATVEPFEQ